MENERVVLKPTWRDIGLFIGAALVLLVLGYWLVIEYQSERAEVTAFCQPRGYVGGFLAWHGVGAGCITNDGREILVSEIRRREQ